MRGSVLDQQTYLPSGEAEAVLSFMGAHGPPSRYYLAGPGPGDRIEVPLEVHRILLQVLEAMRAGKAVTIAPQSQKLTTQQAADLLGVSRPTVVKLIDDGKLDAEIPVGVRRLLRLDDVLRFREERRSEQYAALLATEFDDYDIADDPEEIGKHLRKVRKELTQTHRAPDV